MTEEKTFCPGCPRRGVFLSLGKLKFVASGTVVCDVVDARPPRPKARPHGGAPHARPGGDPKAMSLTPGLEVLVIDGSTFMESGLGLLKRVVKDGGSTVSVILDDGASVAAEDRGDIDIAGLCRDLGVARVRTVEPYSLKGSAEVLSEEAEADGASVVIVEGPCALRSEAQSLLYEVDADKCEGCEHCLKAECSAMRVVARLDGGKMVEIDAAQCAGCGICLQLCKHEAIFAVNRLR